MKRLPCPDDLAARQRHQEEPQELGVETGCDGLIRTVRLLVVDPGAIGAR